MCGRIDINALIDQLEMRFQATAQNGYDLAPRYNVAPTSSVPVVLSIPGVGRRVTVQRWGLEPFGEGRPVLFNARADKLFSLRRYKTGVENKRCIIPVSGYYEWKAGKTRTPYYIHCAQTPIIGLAGFWEERHGNFACTVLTVNANEQMAGLHNRMPVILRREDEVVWLNPNLRDLEKIAPMIVPYPTELDVYEVGKAVGNSRVDNAALREPAAPAAITPSLFES